MCPIRVSIIPWSPSFLNNRLFSLDSISGSHAGNKHWMYHFKLLREEALKENISIDTCDVMSPIDANIVIFTDLPRSLRELVDLKRRAPHLKIIFFPIESPLGRKYVFNRSNHKLFDAILSYNHLLEDGVRYFHFDLPATDASFRTKGKPYSNRKLASMICGKAYLKFKTGIKVIRNGWNFSVYEWFDYAFCLGELVSTRHKLVSAFETYAPGAVDVYGDGWKERSNRFFDKFVNNKPPSSAKGRLDSNKLEVLGNYKFNFCFENCQNDCGYISEKIFDALFADTVPVYLGNRSVERYIPSDCFVNAQDFKNHKELIQFLLECPERVWEDYIQAGQSFLESGTFNRFMPSTFVENFLTPIRALSTRGEILEIRKL